MDIEFKELTVGEVIGRGSFSIVHHGQWRGQQVALKKLRLPSGVDQSQVQHWRSRNYEVYKNNIFNYSMQVIIT